jgi:undecaprenyl-diphosphatase
VNSRALLIPAAAFLVLAGAVALAGILPGDVWLRELILAHAAAPVTAVFKWINYAGTWRVLAPASLALLGFSRVRRRWLVWLLLMIVAPLLEGALKELIARPRPEGRAFGFPSGHATAAAAYFGALIYAVGDLPTRARRALRWAAAAMIVLVALARVVLGAHWPSDTLGGIALGLACATAAALISSSTDRSRAGSTSPAAPSPGVSSRTPPARG